jgi:hypothetical protein
MHCYICDRDMTDTEIQWNSDGKFYEPCTTCLEIALDAAYSDGFDHDEDIISVLDSEFDTGDASDIVHSQTNKFLDE